MTSRIPSIGFCLLAIVSLSLGGCAESGSSYDTTPSSYADSEDEDEPEYFHGYECTDDCSGHDAGYQWAEDNDVTDPDDCDGYSDSFIEGCQAYAEEQ